MLKRLLDVTFVWIYPPVFTQSVTVRAAASYTSQPFKTWMSLLPPLLYIWASSRGKYVSMHIQLCLMSGHRSRENKLRPCSSTGWHSGFQPWSMKLQFPILTELISTDQNSAAAAVGGGADPCTSTADDNSYTHFSRSLRRLPTTWLWAGFVSEQHGTEWSDSGNLRVFTSNGSSHLHSESEVDN